MPVTATWRGSRETSRRALVALSVLGLSSALISAGSARAASTRPNATVFTHVTTTRLGANVDPTQVVSDRLHHRLYVDAMGSLEVVNTRTGRVLGRPTDIAPYDGILPDLAHNRVYVLPSGVTRSEPYVRVMRGDKELAKVRLKLWTPEAPIFSAVVDPTTGWLYLDMTSDADLPSTLWVINGGKVLAKIPTGIQSVPTVALSRNPETGDVYVPEVDRDRSGNGPVTYKLLTVHGDAVTKTTTLTQYPNVVTARGASTYIEGGGEFAHYRNGVLVSSASVENGRSAVVARNGTGFVAQTGQNGDEVSVVRGDSSLASVPGTRLVFDPSTQQAYALSAKGVTVLSGGRTLSSVALAQARYQQPTGWYDSATHEVIVPGLHRTLVFKDGVVVQRLATGRDACAGTGTKTLFISSCATGRLTTWRSS